MIRHVEGPGRFNEEAFKTLDKVLQVANELGVRVTLAFVDNWRWWGGPREYAGFRGKPRDAFWTDPESSRIMKPRSGLSSPDGIPTPARSTGMTKRFLPGKPGTSSRRPFSWTKEIAAYTKSLDTNHLLIDGTSFRVLSQESLDDPDIDIVTTHHYHSPKAALEKS